jgi:hypothetical protein
MKTFCAVLLFVSFIFCINDVNSQATSSAKNLTDLQTELLNIINANKSSPIQDLLPLMHNQTEAAIQSIKRSGKMPTKEEINTMVADTIAKLPKDGSISGNGVQKFQKGFTSHLMLSFGLSA